MAKHLSSDSGVPPDEAPPQADIAHAARSLDLGGAGGNFFWSNLPTISLVAGSVFLVSYTVRSLGPVAYGAVVTVTAATMFVGLFTSALRFAVVHAKASGGKEGQADAEQAVIAAHAFLIYSAFVLLVITAGLAWLVPLDLHQHGVSGRRIYLATLMMVGAALLGLITVAYNGIMTSAEQFGRLARVAVATFAVQVLLTVVLVKPYGIIGVAWATLAAGFVQAVSLIVLGKQEAPWLALFPARVKKATAIPVLRYAVGIALLQTTVTLSNVSDSFVIGGLVGAGGVTTFRIGSVAPTTVVGLLYQGNGVLFPRLVRAGHEAQEEGVAFMGRVIGWLAGATFGALALMGRDVVHLLLGSESRQASVVLWVCSAALALDVAYHGVVQVLFARGQQSVFVRVTWVELLVNLGATVGFVAAFGPIGSAYALATTIAVTDVLLFPIIMRGKWGTPAGRFVLRNGLSQTALATTVCLATGGWLVAETTGLAVHLLATTGAVSLSLGVGVLLLGDSGRSRLEEILTIRRSRRGQD